MVDAKGSLPPMTQRDSLAKKILVRILRLCIVRFCYVSDLDVGMTERELTDIRVFVLY